MKLYDCLRAPNPRRVRWVMAEKAATDIEIVPVDILKGEHRTPEYVAATGVTSVPVLKLDDGTVITESIAIGRYLESIFPEPNLFGRDAREVAIVEMWMRRAEFLLAMPLMFSVRHSHPAFAALEEQVPEVAAANLSAVKLALELFDRHLSGSPYIGSDRVTIADIVAFISLDFARIVRFAPPPELVHLVCWSDVMRGRHAATASIEAQVQLDP